MKVHLRSHLGKYLAISTAAFVVTALACILIPANGDNLQWLKIASVALPGGMLIAVYLRSYRPSGKMLHMAFPEKFSLGRPIGPVSLHHKISDLLVIILKRILGNRNEHFRIARRLNEETLSLTVNALKAGYNAVCFSSVHLQTDQRYLAFVAQLRGRLPNVDIQSTLNPATDFERTLLWLATGKSFRELPVTHRSVTVSLLNAD